MTREEVKAVHERDLTDGWDRVLPPDAIDRKYPNASKEWRWQWIFPQENHAKNSKTGEERRLIWMNRTFRGQLAMQRPRRG